MGFQPEARALNAAAVSEFTASIEAIALSPSLLPVQTSEMSSQIFKKIPEMAFVLHLT